MRKDETRSRPLAKRLRRRMTDAETILWSRLRGDAMQGRRFRRQHPIGPYVADFACVPARLIVEIDGATHGTDVEQVRDRKRDTYLRTRGWRVLRFQNEDVYKRLEDVLDGIVRHLPPPGLRPYLPRARGRKTMRADVMFPPPFTGEVSRSDGGGDI